MKEIELMGFSEPNKNGEQRSKSPQEDSPQSKTIPHQTNVKKRQIDISYEPINSNSNRAANGNKQPNVPKKKSNTGQAQANHKQSTPNVNQSQEIKRNQPNANQSRQDTRQNQPNANQSRQGTRQNVPIAAKNNQNRQPPNRDEARQSNSRVHKRRRKKNYILYYIFLSILLTIVLISLSLTVLFNISDIVIDDYPGINKEQVIASSAIKIGDNLMRMNTKKVAAKILNENIMLDSVNVKRKFPNKVWISLDISEPEFGIKDGSEYHYFSKSGRYFTTSDQRSGLVFQGVDVSKVALGEYLTKVTTDEQEMINTLREAIVQSEIPHITYVDVRDISSIKLYYKDEIEIKIGNISLLQYKLEKAKNIIANNMEEGEVGQLDVQVDRKGFFRPIDFIAPW